MHAGLLADLGKPDHVAQLAELGFAPFELVVVNLYPFAETVASGAGPAECVEQIDIGGPSMVRAAAKNHAERRGRHLARPATPTSRRARRGRLHLAQRQRLAAEAFAHTAVYDVAVASWWPTTWRAGRRVVVPALDRRDVGRKRDVLRYGENPHQRAALYTAWRPGGLAQAEQLHGKEMSYNNYVDTDAAVPGRLRLRRAGASRSSSTPTPAASRSGDATIAEAHRKAHACDPVSAFGGVIATNRPVTVRLAEQIAEIFTEVVARAVASTTAPFELLAARRSIRLLELPGSRRRIQHRVPADLGRRAGADRRPGGRRRRGRRGTEAGGDDPRGWRWPAARPPTRPRCATWPSPGGRSAR